MSTWNKEFQETIDQRGEPLPPAWCPRPEALQPKRVQFPDVLQPSHDRVLLEELVRAIRSAREAVVVASFLIADADIEAALLEVAKRGVAVYGLWANEVRLEKELKETDPEFDKRCVEEHKALLLKLTGWSLIRSSSAFHAKALLVDPRQGCQGFLLTANLNRALTHNEELAIRLTPQECCELFEQLRWAIWELADHELLEPGRLSTAKSLGRFEKPSGGVAIVSTLGGPGTLREAALRLVESARERLTVSCFGWDADHEIVNQLCAKARAGVKLVVLARERAASMPALVKLAAAGAEVLGFDQLHAKAIVVDGQSALVMSANLQAHGLEQGFELGVLIHDARVNDVSAVLDEWIASARSVLRVNSTLGDVLGLVRVWNGNGRLHNGEVLTLLEEAPERVVAASAEALDPAWPELKRSPPLLAHGVNRRLVVEAPRLARNAKVDARRLKKPRDDDPKVYRERGGRVVVAVRTPDQLERAVELKRQVQASAIVVDDQP